MPGSRLRLRVLGVWAALAALGGLVLVASAAAGWPLALDAGRRLRWAVLAAGLAALAYAATLWAARRRELASKLLALGLSLAIFTPLAGEGLLRVGIAAGVPRLRDPGLYAPQLESEEYWRLRYRWLPPEAGVAENPDFALDPDFGWVARDNGPRGEPGRPPLLLFGESFMQGVPPVPRQRRIPRLLKELLPGYTIFDYTVSGYGLDQMLLRLRALGDFEKPHIVVGIMTLDLDRAIFGFRDGPKPRFELAGGELVLRGPPLPTDRSTWDRLYRPRTRSFLLAFLRRGLTRLGPVAETEVAELRDEKKAINRAILAAMVAEAERRDGTLTFVLFYPPWDLDFVGWRESFLRQELARLGADVVDTKPALAAAVAAHPAGKDAYFLPPPNNHPGGRANLLIAQLIARHLEGGGAG